MKKLNRPVRFALLGAVALALAAVVYAATPTYKTLTRTGTAALPAQIIFAADPSTQIRIVNITWESDTNVAVVSIRTGVTPFVITATNANSATNITINATNGLTAGDTLVLQKANGYCTNALCYTGIGTNTTSVTLGAGGFGIAAAIGDEIYDMSAATTITLGATTNAINGEAIYVGNNARPLLLLVTPANVGNKVTASARYE